MAHFVGQHQRLAVLGEGDEAYRPHGGEPPSNLYPTPGVAPLAAPYARPARPPVRRADTTAPVARLGWSKAGTWCDRDSRSGDRSWRYRCERSSRAMA